MTSHELARNPAGRLDAATAERTYEVVALRLALGLLRVLDDASADFGTTRDELLALLAESAPDAAPTGGIGSERVRP
jgi:hypothetical protein